MTDLVRNLIPYGVQNFASLRERGLCYVDKTGYIRQLEIRSGKLFFVRPRRMGKSLFVDMLARYYDIVEKENFQKLFGGLEIGRNPTELANSFYVLRLDFSHYLYVHYQDFSQIACEEIRPQEQQEAV